MAAFQINLNTAEVALTAATARTILQAVAPTNQVVKLLGWGVYFDGVLSTAEPVVVELVRQTNAGTMTSLTPVKVDPGRDETIQTTAQHTATAEPTTTDVVSRVEVHPQAGYEIVLPFSQEIIIPGGGRLGLRCTAPAGVNAVGRFRCEE